MNKSHPSAQQPVRAAIVGAGLMGRWHAHALTHVGGKVVGLVDTQQASAQRLARSYHASAYASLEELLSQGHIDIVHICTPLATHVELALQALAAGAHVLVEKPLAPDASLTAQLLDRAATCNRLVVPVHQFIFQSGVQSALSRLPQLSPLVHLEFTALTAGGEAMDDAGRDQLVADILPHALALFQRCLPNGLAGVEWQVNQPTAGELRALGRHGDTSLQITVSTRGRPTRNDLTISGARGSVHADLFHGFAVFETERVSRAQKILRPFNLSARTLTTASWNLVTRALNGELAYPGLRELIGACYHSIRNGTAAPIAPQETLAVARARDQLLASCKMKSL